MDILKEIKVGGKKLVEGKIAIERLTVNEFWLVWCTENNDITQHVLAWNINERVKEILGKSLVGLRETAYKF